MTYEKKLKELLLSSKDKTKRMGEKYQINLAICKMFKRECSIS